LERLVALPQTLESRRVECRYRFERRPGRLATRESPCPAHLVEPRIEQRPRGVALVEPARHEPRDRLDEIALRRRRRRRHRRRETIARAEHVDEPRAEQEPQRAVKARIPEERAGIVS